MTLTTAWTLIAIAIVIEVVATSFLTASQGFTRVWLGVAALLSYSVAFYLLAQALRLLPVGVVYAAWSGLGIVLISLVGWIVFRQTLGPLAILGIAMIVTGVLILNLATRGGGH
jgi:small multidrug resistance pump